MSRHLRTQLSRTFVVAWALCLVPSAYATSIILEDTPQTFRGYGDLPLNMISVLPTPLFSSIVNWDFAYTFCRLQPVCSRVSDDIKISVAVRIFSWVFLPSPTENGSDRILRRIRRSR